MDSTMDDEKPNEEKPVEEEPNGEKGGENMDVDG
jgi:hypothetical protein